MGQRTEDRNLGSLKVGSRPPSLAKSRLRFGGLANGHGLQFDWQQMARAIQASLSVTFQTTPQKQPVRMWKDEWTLRRPLILCRMSVFTHLDQQSCHRIADPTSIYSIFLSAHIHRAWSLRNYATECCLKVIPEHPKPQRRGRGAHRSKLYALKHLAPV